MIEDLGTITLLLQGVQASPAEPGRQDQLYRSVEKMLCRIVRKKKRQLPAPSLPTLGLVDEVFLELVNRVASTASGMHESDFYKLAATVVWRRLIDHTRRQRLATLDPAEAAGRVDESAPSPDAEALDTERFLALADAVAELERTDERAALVFKMRCFQEWALDEERLLEPENVRRDRFRSFKEIAGHLGMAQGTAHLLWVRACEVLQARLQGFAPDAAPGDRP
jgi:RNA polymerase sigma factor (sigma-70 family)